MTLKVLDLFSGIGGFSLGLERAGLETVAFCEIDPYCQKILAKHWPKLKIFNDIKNLSRSDLSESVDVICGGFPCQPFSVAGRKKGEEDDRDLWPEMFRIIQEFKPTWVIGENVANFANMAFKRTKSNLESEGYEVQPFIIPACSLEGRHKRDRVWIIAHYNRENLWPEQESESWSKGETLATDDGKKRSTTDSASERSQGQGTSGHEVYTEENQDWKTSEFIHERINQFRSFESGICGVANGVPNRVDRLKSLGNAVVPIIPEVIGRALLHAEGVQK